MTPSQNNDKFDELISNTIGRNGLKFDFDKWKLDHTEAVQQYQEQVNNTNETAAPERSGLWRVLMKNNITKYAAAAVIIVAIMIGLNHFGYSPDIAKRTWAGSLEQIQKVPVFIFRMVTKIEGMKIPGLDKMPVTEGHMMYSIEHGMRMEMTTDGKVTQLIYMNPQENDMFTLMPEQKKYMRLEFGDDLAAKMQKEQKKNDPREMFKQVLECEYVELGRKEIDGVEVEGIETTDPKYGGGMFENILVRIWVDVEQGWPVLMEMDMAMDSPTGEGQVDIHIEMNDFLWDVEVDPAEFVPVIPDDYSEMASVKMPKMDVESAIEGFRLYAEITDRYPEKLNMMSLISDYGKVRTEKLLQDPEYKQIVENQKAVSSTKESNRDVNESQDEPGGDQAKLTELLEKKMNGQIESQIQETMKIQGLAMFHMLLIQEKKEPQYFGDVVGPQDVGKVLMMWKGAEGEFEVIYGDLTTDTIDATEDVN